MLKFFFLRKLLSFQISNIFKTFSLHDEVFDLYLWLKPTAEEIFLRRSVFNRVADILKSIYPNAQVFVFGSVATNLFLPSSDIDIVINLSNFTIECLHNVAEKFRFIFVICKKKLL